MPPPARERAARGAPALTRALLGCAVLAACDGPPATPPATPPEGAVVQVGATWVLEEEVDRHVPAVALIEPDETRRSWRRKALTNLVIPVKVSSLLPDAAQREASRRRVEAALTALALGGEPPADGPQVERVEGTWREVGLDHWSVAHALGPGRWSDVYETVAGFVAVRLAEGPDPAVEEWNGGTRVVLELVADYYLPLDEDPHFLVSDARRQMEIRAVAPEWEWILPKFYQYPR